VNAKLAKGSKRGLNAEDAKVTQRRREEGIAPRSTSARGGSATGARRERQRGDWVKRW